MSVTGHSLALVLAFVLGGCDSLFSLVHVAPVDDARPADARDDDGTIMVDATPDAYVCHPIGHLEDGDNIDDACDSCPTFTDVGADTDGDGLDNACDPQLAGNKDTILYATGFPSAGTLVADFSTTGNVQWDPANKGQVTMFEGSTMQLTTPYRPTKIEIRTSGVGEGIGAQVDVGHSGAVCSVLGSDCNKAVTSTTCVSAAPSGSDVGIAFSAGNVKLIELVGPATIVCGASAAGQSSSAVAGVAFTSSQLTLATTSSGSVVIDSIVIYGAKP